MDGKQCRRVGTERRMIGRICKGVCRRLSSIYQGCYRSIVGLIRIANVSCNINKDEGRRMRGKGRRDLALG